MTNEQKNRPQTTEPAGFTPGPWEKVDVGYGFEIEPSVCWIGENSNTTKRQRIANAALIAAAPKMYAALCILHDAMLDTGMLPDAVAAIEDVIKEARGER